MRYIEDFFGAIIDFILMGITLIIESIENLMDK